MTINQTNKILSIVEATTINAVAKNVLEFHSAARMLAAQSPDFPSLDACLVTFDRSGESAPTANAFIDAARELQLEVEIIPERRRFDFAAIAALRSVVERQNPDIVVTHSVKSHFLMWRSQVWRERPWVAFHHGYTTTDLKMRVYNKADRWSLPHASRLVTVCHAFARELAQNTGVPINRIVVQHNSVRPAPQFSSADIQSFRTGLGVAENQPMILSVGRLSREKAHIDLLAAFKVLRETKLGISSKLIIVGDGPELAALEAAARLGGMNERVLFTGQTRDVQPFYAAADIFALPSHSEGSPNVVLEAMAANLPIVATAAGGVPEILEDNKTALLVPVNQPAAMAERIAQLLDDKDLGQRLASNAATLITSRFTSEQYVRSLTKTYLEAIREQKFV